MTLWRALFGAQGQRKRPPAVPPGTANYPPASAAPASTPYSYSPLGAPNHGANPAGSDRTLTSADLWRLAWRIVALATATILGIWLILNVQPLLVQFLLAIILAAGLHPLVERLHNAGIPRVVSVLLVYSVFLSAISIALLFILPRVVGDLNQVLRLLPEYWGQLLTWIRDLEAALPWLPPIEAQIQQQVQDFGPGIGTVATQAFTAFEIAMSLFGGVFAGFLVLVLTLYLIVDGQSIREYLLRFVPLLHRPRFAAVSDRIGERLGGWVLGQLTVAVLVGLGVYVGLSLIGVPGAAFLAILAGILELMPFLGPILASIPAIALATALSPGLGLATLVFYVVLQQVESYVLTPRVMGHAVELHPFAVLTSVILGGYLLGIAGALVAVPIAVTLSVILAEVQRERWHADQETPSAKSSA